jgi:hypothetical protein
MGAARVISARQGTLPATLRLTLQALSFLDLLAAGFVEPLVTPLAKKHGASPLVASAIGSTYGLFQVRQPVAIWMHRSRDGTRCLQRGGACGLRRRVSGCLGWGGLSFCMSFTMTSPRLSVYSRPVKGCAWVCVDSRVLVASVPSVVYPCALHLGRFSSAAVGSRLRTALPIFIF